MHDGNDWNRWQRRYVYLTDEDLAARAQWEEAVARQRKLEIDELEKKIEARVKSSKFKRVKRYALMDTVTGEFSRIGGDSITADLTKAKKQLVSGTRCVLVELTCLAVTPSEKS